MDIKERAAIESKKVDVYGMLQKISIELGEYIPDIEMDDHKRIAVDEVSCDYYCYDDEGARIHLGYFKFVISEMFTDLNKVKSIVKNEIVKNINSRTTRNIHIPLREKEDVKSIENNYYSNLIINDHELFNCDDMYVLGRISGMKTAICDGSDNHGSYPMRKTSEGIILKTYCTQEDYERFVTIVQNDYKGLCLFDYQ